MKKILMLENLPYYSHIRIGSHHYANAFATRYKVFWLSLPFHFGQFLKDPKSERFKSWNFNRPKLISKQLYSFTPFVLLPFRNNLILKSNWFLKNYCYFMPFLFRLLKVTGFLNPDIVWITDPRHFSVLRQVQYNKIFYRCVDDLEAFSDIPEGLVHYEQEVVKIANACFFTSNELLNKFRGLNPASFYLPNGCDYDFFQGKEAGADVKAFFKEEMLNFLYMGTIAEWFDFEVIEKLSEDPSHNIVLVGPVRVSIPQKLKSKSNVVFVGPFPYERMKEFANSANVGLIPFKVNSITDSVNPIKLYEYCAAGLPVISAGFRTIMDLEGPFVIYRDFIELSNSVIWAKSAIQDEKSIDEIKRFGKLNSWQNRSDFVSSFFEG